MAPRVLVAGTLSEELPPAGLGLDLGHPFAPGFGGTVTPGVRAHRLIAHSLARKRTVIYKSARERAVSANSLARKRAVNCQQLNLARKRTVNCQLNLARKRAFIYKSARKRAGGGSHNQTAGDPPACSRVHPATQTGRLIGPATGHAHRR